MTNLTHLNLGYNRLRALPSSLSGLVSLKELFLHRNKLRWLPSSIGRIPKLTFLRLGFNEIIHLPATFAASCLSTSLQKLYMSHNKVREGRP